MMAAATVSSLHVLATRLCRRSSSVRPSDLTSGIMLTPVSNPDSPRTRSGNASTVVCTMEPTPPVAVSLALPTLVSQP